LTSRSGAGAPEAIELRPDFVKAKSRLTAARYYYDVVLAGNVRRYDAKHGSKLHEATLADFDRARSQLGRPALRAPSATRSGA